MKRQTILDTKEDILDYIEYAKTNDLLTQVFGNIVLKEDDAVNFDTFLTERMEGQATEVKSFKESKPSPLFKDNSSQDSNTEDTTESSASTDNTKKPSDRIKIWDDDEIQKLYHNIKLNNHPKFIGESLDRTPNSIQGKAKRQLKKVWDRKNEIWIKSK